MFTDTSSLESDPRHSRANRRIAALLDGPDPTRWAARTAGSFAAITELTHPDLRAVLPRGCARTATEVILFLPDVAARVARGRLDAVRLHVYTRPQEAQDLAALANPPTPHKGNPEYLCWLAGRLREALIERFNPVAVTAGYTAETWVSYAVDYPCYRDPEYPVFHGVFPPRMAHALLRDPDNYLVLRNLGTRRENWARACLRPPGGVTIPDSSGGSVVNPALLAVYCAWQTASTRGTTQIASETTGVEFDTHGYLLISWPKFLTSEACPEALRTDLTIPRVLSEIFAAGEVSATPTSLRITTKRQRTLFDCSRALVTHPARLQRALQLGVVETDDRGEATEQWNLLDPAVLAECPQWFTEAYTVQKFARTESTRKRARKIMEIRASGRRHGNSTQEIHDTLVAHNLARATSNTVLPTHQVRFAPLDHAPAAFRYGEQPVWFPVDHVENIRAVRRSNGWHFAPGALMDRTGLSAQWDAHAELDVLNRIIEHFALVDAQTRRPVLDLSLGELIAQATLRDRIQPFVQRELVKTAEGLVDVDDGDDRAVGGVEGATLRQTARDESFAQFEAKLLAQTLTVAEQSPARLAQLKVETGRRLAATPGYQGTIPARWFPEMLLAAHTSLEPLRDLCAQAQCAVPDPDGADGATTRRTVTFFSEYALRVIRDYASGSVVTRSLGADSGWDSLLVQAPAPAPYIYAWANCCLSALKDPTNISDGAQPPSSHWTPQMDFDLLQGYHRFPQMSEEAKTQLVDKVGKQWANIRARGIILRTVMDMIVPADRGDLFRVGFLHHRKRRPEDQEMHLIRMVTLMGLFQAAKKHGIRLGKSTPYVRKLTQSSDFASLRTKLELKPTYADPFYSNALYDPSLIGS